MIGVFNDESYLDKIVYVNEEMNFKIVGISDTSNPSLYVDDQYIMTIIANAEIDSNCPRSLRCFISHQTSLNDFVYVSMTELWRNLENSVELT